MIHNINDDHTYKVPVLEILISILLVRAPDSSSDYAPAAAAAAGAESSFHEHAEIG